MTYRRALKNVCCAALLIVSISRAEAACEFEIQGEGHVSRIIDGRTLRLDDGRDVRLAGVELLTDDAAGAGVLAELIEGRDVTLHGADDRPDRYGQQIAFVTLKGTTVPLQFELVARGVVAASPTVADQTCFAALLAAEGTARSARRGFWAGSAALKNAEKSDDILTRMGRFTVVEGTISSTRLAGATFYINFGRRWTRDFAVTISRRMMASFQSAGIDLNSLMNKKIRVRGWIERRGGPRIEASRAGQIEIIGTADAPAKGHSASAGTSKTTDEGK